MFTQQLPILAIAIAITPSLCQALQDSAIPEESVAESRSLARVVSYDLELSLEPPRVLKARAQVELAEVVGAELSLWLNRMFRVHSIRTAEGEELRWRRGKDSDAGTSREGRPLRIDLGQPPEDGRVTIVLEYSGKGEKGKRDWRGALIVDADEVRMSEQTVFYPQVPLAPGSRRQQRAPGVVRVAAPAELEVFVAGQQRGEPELGEDGRRLWTFDCENPSVFSVVAGRYRRESGEVSGTRISTLLFAEHAQLGPAIARESRRVLDAYRTLFGDNHQPALGVAEMRRRGNSSYNWASQGLIVMERGALRSGVPGDTIAHECAHLWWGALIAPRGLGERFLTESLAEYSAWRYRAQIDGAAGARALAEKARASYLKDVHQAGADAALARVDFRTPGYSGLAYAKGPLALRRLAAHVGEAELDAALRRFAQDEERRAPTLEDFRACLRRELGPELDLSWLEREGHLHLELADCSYSSERQQLSGKLLVSACEDSPDLVLRGEVVLGIRSGREERRERILFEGAQASFEFEQPSPPDILHLDPDVTLLADVGQAVMLGGCRLLTSKPAADSMSPMGGTRIVLEFERPLAEQDFKERMRNHWRKRARELDKQTPRPVDVQLADDGRLVIQTRPWRAGHEYFVALGPGLEDVDGRPVAPVEFTFRIAPSDDVTTPQVVATVPDNGAEAVSIELDVLSFSFSERMGSGSGFSSKAIEANAARGFLFPDLGKARWSEDYTTISYPLDEPLRPGSTYLIPIRNAFSDLSGNGVEELDLVFTTAER